MTEVVSQPGLLGSLGIKAELFGAQLLNFLIILFIVWRFVYRPLLRTMDKRTKKITDGLRDADEAKMALQKAQESKKAVLKEADKEAQALIDKAHAEAEEQRKEMLAETHREIEKHVEQARQQMKDEREATVKAVKSEMAQLVMVATEKVLGKGLTDKDQHAFIERELKDLERSS